MKRKIILRNTRNRSTEEEHAEKRDGWARRTARELRAKDSRATGQCYSSEMTKTRIQKFQNPRRVSKKQSIPMQFIARLPTTTETKSNEKQKTNTVHLQRQNNTYKT